MCNLQYTGTLTLPGLCLGTDSLKFMVLGDWGGLPLFPFYTSIERGVAKQMGVIKQKFGGEFILALGDNFYYDGVKDVDDKRFKETYDSVFNADSLKSVPWYLVAGNHDHNGNVSAQIAYSKREKRWNFKDFYYLLQFPVPGGKNVDIVMIDTVLLCGNSDHDIKHQQPKKPENKAHADKQWAWIEQQLQNSKADYLLVAGHYPIYSIAEHGPTECLVDKLLPLVQKYQVTAYLSGHDHNLQHLEIVRPGLKVNLFVIGAANFADQSNKHKDSVPSGSSKFFWAEEKYAGGFAKVELTSTNMTLTFIAGEGKELYQQVLYPRHQNTSALNRII